MQTLRTIFKEIDIPSHRISLVQDILQKIVSLSEAKIRRQKRMFLLGSIFSFVGFSFSVFFFGGMLVQSEYFSVLSVFFSDISTVALYLSDFTLLLLETLPAVPLLAIFTSVFFFCIFLFLYYTETKSVHRSSY